QLIENLERELEKRGTGDWKNDAAALFLAAARKEMFVGGEAPVVPIPAANGGWFDEYAQKAMGAYLLGKYFPDSLPDDIREDFYDSSVAALSDGGFATFSASWGVRALTASGFVNASEALKTKISCPENGRGETRLFAGGKALEFDIDQCSRILLEPGKESGKLFWQVSQTGYDRAPDLAAEDRGIAITRIYFNKNGEPVTEFEQGDEITVRAEARMTNGRKQDCVIADLLPGGAEFILGRETEREENGKIKYIDRRDDRILVYADLDSEPVGFSYKIRAANKGIFRIPAIRGEAMYDQTVYGQGEGGVLKIK
ncbi:MAG: hypothetical protein K2H64_04705, partial [Desulfovibrio sp.]|nr:hypothetical protein [Desulfovibrio sp.]